MFSLIAVIGQNRELGKNNQLIFHLKDDLQFFRKTTTGHKVVMGRKTWDSLPKKLENRKNIVVSHHNFSGPDLIIHDVRQFIDQNQNTPEEIFIIGGGMIYSKFLPYAKNIYLTEIDASHPSATAFFPDFDKSSYSCQILKTGKDHNLTYSINKYTKKEQI